MLWVVAFVGVLVLFAVARNQQRRRWLDASTVRVEADAEGVRRILADGRAEELAWSEATSIDVFAAKRGPYGEAGGAVVIYGDAERGCVVPFDQLADSGLLVELGRLPGFDTAALLAAMQHRAHEITEVWTRPEPPAIDPPTDPPTEPPT